MDSLWQEAADRVRGTDSIRAVGRVAKLVGLVVEVEGLAAAIGALCSIDIGRNRPPVLCEVVGFRDVTALLMPYGSMVGLMPGQKVRQVSQDLSVPVGRQLLGRILDGFGRPIDGGPALNTQLMRPTSAAPPAALERKRIEERLPTGVRSIDSLVSVARGQRMGIFAGSGVGKSVLLGMLARNAAVDVNVVALIGERGREVREFIERDLGPEGLARSVVVVVTSDESAVLRAKGAETATAIAEYFRATDHNVLFLMDSITRYAMALREIGLAAGEPPTTKGYTPSVFAALPRLCERAGWSAVNAITAFYTVLIEGDDIHDPVGDAVRSILDGHIMLSRDLARDNHYPAIDVLGSISRLRNQISEPEQIEAGAEVLRWLKALEDNKDLINIGAYASGTDPLVDKALARRDRVRSFLCQAVEDPAAWTESAAELLTLVGED